MTKDSLLKQLYNIKATQEREFDQETIALQLLDLLLTYINDKDIRESLEEIPW